MKNDPTANIAVARCCREARKKAEAEKLAEVLKKKKTSRIRRQVRRILTWKADGEMSKFSRDKGKRGERLFCTLCKEHGYDVHRTSQFCGKTGEAGDVEGLEGIHVEVKFCERLNLRDAMAQSKRDALAEGKGNLPIVAHKKANEDWLITMDADAFFLLYREWLN